jgi:membrane carboxypeptidase/penicillin-binding protein
VLAASLQRVRARSGGPWFPSQAISKTGTTNEARTCWYAGSTPEFTTVVYVGRDDNKPLGNGVYPIKTAFPIWFAMQFALPCAANTFTHDPSLTLVTINEKTGEQAHAGMRVLV